MESLGTCFVHVSVILYALIQLLFHTSFARVDQKRSGSIMEKNSWQIVRQLKYLDIVYFC